MDSSELVLENEQSCVISFATLPFELFRDAISSVYDTLMEARSDIRQMKASFVHYASLLMVTYTYCFIGGFLFIMLEGWHEVNFKCELLRERQYLIDELWNKSAELDYNEWKTFVEDRFQTFEENVHKAHDAGINTYSGSRVWSFDGALVYSLTILTTIGYGHIVPSTTAGQALTMIYATIGIPLLLMVLADFGKLLTRAIKAVCVCIHRFYHTGSCKKLRNSLPVQAVARAMSQRKDNTEGNNEDTGSTNKEIKQNDCYQIDDDFNLPPYVALILLVGYIMIGACMFIQWENNWTYFEAVYFVFISMSTIGFGDYVPDHPIFMMGTFLYLLFGLALTSMCINVIQESLTNTFRQASEKLSLRMGIEKMDNSFIHQNQD